MDEPTPAHDPSRCGGCGALMRIEDLAAWLGASRSTLYKWSRRGEPQFPRAAKLPNGRLLVRCADALTWLEGRCA